MEHKISSIEGELVQEFIWCSTIFPHKPLPPSSIACIVYVELLALIKRNLIIFYDSSHPLLLSV